MPEPTQDRVGDAGRSFVGLAVLGWGLAILLRVTPHEDFVVGAGLLIFGLALVATAPRLPRIGRVPPRLLALLGAGAIAAVLGYNAWFHAPLDSPKFAILALGAALVAAAPFAAREIRLPLRDRPSVTMGSLAAFLLPVVGAPLAVWTAQATFKSLLGVTPIETFIRIGLLLPLQGFLWLFGLHPNLAGQTITYATPRGPLAVDVGAACSGVQAMALFGGVLALYLFAERPGGRQLAFWSFVGLAGVYCANLLRLAVLTLIGYKWGGEALEQTHAQAGWVFFVLWAVLFARLARGRTAGRGPGRRAIRGGTVRREGRVAVRISDSAGTRGESEEFLDNARAPSGQ